MDLVEVAPNAKPPVCKVLDFGKYMYKKKKKEKEKIKEEIKSRIDPRSFEEEPVAFGLKALKVLKVIPEDAGGPDEYEGKIKDIENVQNVKVVDQRKLL